MSHTYINFPSFWLHGWAWNCPVQEKGRGEGCAERTDSNELLPVHKCSLPRVPCAKHQILPDVKPRVTSCRAMPAQRLVWEKLMDADWVRPVPTQLTLYLLSPLLPSFLSWVLGYVCSAGFLGWWETPWSWHWCLVAGHPEFLFWERLFFFFLNMELEGKSHTWREEIRRRETKVES